MRPTDLRPSSSVNVRRAVLEDLPAMALVHVNGWKTAYRGMMPDELLDRLTVESDIASGFGSGLKERRPEADQWVAQTSDGAIVGYAVAPIHAPAGDGLADRIGGGKVDRVVGTFSG